MSNTNDQQADASAPAPATAQANNGQASASVDPAIVAEIAKSVRDSVFADLRRTGQLGKATKQAPQSASTEEAPAAAAPSPDLGKLRTLDRALSRSGLAQKLSDRQMERLERAYLAESPESAETFVRDYFDGLGVVPAASNAAPATAANAAPVSNGGGVPTPRVPPEEMDLVRMSESDRRHLVAQKGTRWFVETLRKQMTGRRVSIR